MSYKNILELFRGELDITFNDDLYRELKRFRITWANKTPDHIQALGGNLTGVYPIIFSSADRAELYSDILLVDEIDITGKLHALPEINPEFNVSGNPLNHILIYIIRGFLFESTMAKSKRIDAAREAFLILAYRYYSSLMQGFFPHQVNPQIATVVYERLSNRFLLKKLGSWQAVIEHRYQNFTDPKRPNYKRLERFKTVDSIELTNDSQGRLRNMIKYIWSVFDKVLKSGEAIYSESATMKDINGEEVVRDILDRKDKYIDYMIEIMYDLNDLAKLELIHVIVNLVPGLEAQHLYDCLSYISELSTTNKKKVASALMEHVLVTSIEYLSNHKQDALEVGNIESALVALKGMWVSSRGNSSDVDKVKKLGSKIVTKAITKKTKWVAIRTRLGLFLYIYLRAVVYDHYSHNVTGITTSKTRRIK